MFSLNQFAVFGFADNSHSISGGLINVSLNVNVSQAALVCMQCQLAVSDSQLVFIAGGQVLSAVCIKVLSSMELTNTSVQHRFQSLQAAGIVSQISEPSLTVSLVDVKLNGYNSERSQSSGYLISKLSVSISVIIANLQACATEGNAVGSGLVYLQLNGDVLSTCLQSCPVGSFYSYGVCVAQLVHGEMQDNSTLACVDPFEFDGEAAECACKDGYVLNISHCIPIAISITNLDTTMKYLNNQTNTMVEQQKQHLESMIVGNTSMMSQYLNGNITNLSASVSQGLADAQNDLASSVTQLQQQIINSMDDAQTMMANNRSVVESQIAGNISWLQETLYQNVSDLNQTIQLEIQVVNQSAIQIAGDLSDLKSGVAQIVADQMSNNADQQSRIAALRQDVQTLQSGQLLLTSDLAHANSSLNTQIQTANTYASQIDARVASLASQTTNQYDLQQTQLSDLDRHLAQNVSDLSASVQQQVQILTQADSALQSSFSALQGQFSSFSSASVLNSTNQLSQINSLQSAVSSQQTALQQSQSDISTINTSLASQLNSINSQFLYLNSLFNSFNSTITSHYNNQQQYASNIQVFSSNILDHFSSLLTSFNNLISNTNTQLQAEIQTRIASDQSFQMDLNTILTNALNNKNTLYTINSSLNALVNNMFTNASQIYATKEEIYRYLCLKKASHNYVNGVCILVCGSGATASGEICICSNSNLVYTGGICQLVCGSGAVVQSGVCVCTNASLKYINGTCTIVEEQICKEDKNGVKLPCYII
ncbi:Conserved_hypothetical protein [Hexamita inflata]|uniref:Uncharacterized protein n=1 Tax=Hexamita inflata TaxID=28002 RepID=A0AA86QS26_9EUKA|nr:Conserved hypothetical protein [Hexamita inflata]